MGIVGTRDGEAVRLLKLRNAAASPLRYEIDASDQCARSTSSTTPGSTSGSSTTPTRARRPSRPRRTSTSRFYPDSLYMIVGVAGPDDDVRLWRIADGQVAEAPLEVVEG